MTWLLLVGVALASSAMGAAILCQGIPDVTALSPDGCYVPVGTNDVTFNNFQVIPGGGGITDLTVGITSYNLTGGNVNLQFSIGQIVGTPTAGDFKLLYQVNGPTTGVDLHFQGSQLTPGSLDNVTITEVACTEAFANNTTCNGTTLANLIGSSFGNTVNLSQSFDFFTGGAVSEADTVFIKKDIQFNNAALSEFTNSHAVPEPLTLSMMGLGLLGVGLLGRRRRLGKQ